MSNHIRANIGLRARGIKPQIYTCDILGQLDLKIMAFYTFLPSVSDRHGVFYWNPAKIRAQLFPYRYDLTPALLESWLDVLVESGKIIKYSNQGEDFGYIRDYHLEQRPHHTEKASGLKLPDGVEVPKPLMRMTREGSPTCHRDGTVINNADKDTDTDTDTDTDSKDQGFKGQEGEKHRKGQEGEKHQKTAKASLNKNNWGIKIPLSDGTFFVPSQYDIEGYQQGFPSIDVPTELLKMVEHKTNNPGLRVDPKQVNRSIYATLKQQEKFNQGHYRE